MAKDKLISERPKSDEPNPHKRFEEFASKIVTVPKSTIDEREKQWQTRRERKKQR